MLMSNTFDDLVERKLPSKAINYTLYFCYALEYKKIQCVLSRL